MPSSVTSPTYDPPPSAPPFLTDEQVQRLKYQGHLPIQLPAGLNEGYADLFSRIDTFFAQPTPSKTSQYPAGHGTELGYYHVESEKEYLTLRNAAGASGLEAAVREIWRKTMAMLERVLGDVSRDLNLDPKNWDLVLDGCQEMPKDFDVESKTLMRLFRYEPRSGVAAVHTDNGILTLCMGKGQGLQCWERSPHDASTGRWIDAQGPTLLSGVTLSALSMGTVNAGKHRVVANPEGRNSIVFALRASTRHEIDLKPFGMDERLKLKDLHDEIDRSKVNVNAQKEMRDRKWKEKGLAENNGVVQATG